MSEKTIVMDKDTYDEIKKCLQGDEENIAEVMMGRLVFGDRGVTIDTNPHDPENELILLYVNRDVKKLVHIERRKDDEEKA